MKVRDRYYRLSQKLKIQSKNYRLYLKDIDKELLRYFSTQKKNKWLIDRVGITTSPVALITWDMYEFFAVEGNHYPVSHLEHCNIGGWLSNEGKPKKRYWHYKQYKRQIGRYDAPSAFRKNKILEVRSKFEQEDYHDTKSTGT